MSDDDFYLVNRSATGHLKFRVNSGTEAITVLQGGNVGIGIATPIAKLDVSTSGNTAIPGLGVVPGASTSAVFGNTCNTVILATGVDNANTSWLQ